MNLSLYIAKRYLISKKSHHVINIISWISVIGIGVGTLALIVVLSAFNGLQTLVEDLYASFDPDIKITALTGKTFNINDFPKQEIANRKDVLYCSESIEEVALFKYNDKQTVATLKGVDPVFYNMTGLDSMVYEGQVKADDELNNYLCIGYGIADNLSIYMSNKFMDKISVIVPKKGTQKSFLPTDEFSRKYADASGVFSISPDFDTKYVLSSLEFARALLKHPNRVTSVELQLRPSVNPKKVKQEIQALVGKNFVVKTRFELNELVFKTNETEKWITFLILAFILIIASFNIVGSLTMLIIDKKKDIWILKTMGASNTLIQKIFFTEGMLINLLGAFSGMFLGALICWLQQTYGLLRLHGGIVDFYPVELQFIDFIYVTGTVIVIGLLASWYPARILTKRHLSK